MSSRVVKSLPKAIALTFGIALMLPVAASWQTMFGSVNKAIGNTIAIESAVSEKERMEEELELMRTQLEKLNSLIEKLERESQ